MKLENEITVKITCSYEELTRLMKENGFAVINELELLDTYYIKSEIDIEEYTNSELLSNYLIVRVPSNNNPQITYKYKRFEEDGSIKEQGKVNCDIYDEKQATSLLEQIGYKKLLSIKNHIKFFKREDVLFVAAYVNDEYLCLEYSGKDDETIETVIETFNTKYSFIPHDGSNYFINKAMIEMDKIRNSNKMTL